MTRQTLTAAAVLSPLVVSLAAMPALAAGASGAAGGPLDQLLPWLLTLLASAAAIPATWLAWRVAHLAAGLTSDSLRALAVLVRRYTHRTPDRRDDEVGEAVARTLEKNADNIDQEARKASQKERAE